MSNEQKTAIQGAEKQLETERKEKLQREVYQYLKSELDAIDEIDGQVRKLTSEKKAHEENIKNIKQGNLEAIEKRQESFPFVFTTTIPVSLSSATTSWTTAGSSSAFYNSNLAGMTYTVASGKTYIF